MRLRRFVVGLALLGACRDTAPPPPPPPAAVKPPAVRRPRLMTIAEARPAIDAHADALPVQLRGKAGAGLEAAWNAWAAAHDAEVRGRLARGDEDSIVNLWLYGTSFTSLPRATQQDRERRGAQGTEQLLIDRLDDLVNAMASPGDNERVRFAREVVERHGITPTTEAGRDRARELLVGLRARTIDETNRYAGEARGAARSNRALEAFATIYRERGLSSDTSLPVDFSLHRALTDLAARPDRPAAVRRVAIIGPGLDFTDKSEGFDLYPVQTIQPFAVIESLLRLKLAQPNDLHVSTFDLSPRVNAHLSGAVERARHGIGYTLQLPLTSGDPQHEWVRPLQDYWAAFGRTIGTGAPPIGVPPTTGSVSVHAVRVRPKLVAAIEPADLNIVLQRFDPMAEDEKFDLIVATNVLVYYDGFEQALALANVSAMLRPGGIFLTNYLVHPAPPLERAAGLVTPVYWDRQKNGDAVFGYRYVVSTRRQ